jgi:hypothetical protein
MPGCDFPLCHRYAAAVADKLWPKGDSVKSGPGFSEDELVLESLVNFFGGCLVKKQSTVVHKENVFVASRDVVDEELKEQDTEM